MKYIPILIVAALAGCSNPAGTGPTPASQVYAAKNAYAALLTASVVYNNLPRCTPAIPAPCSDPTAIASMRSANNTVISALDTAEVVVRAGTGPAALAAAQTAVQAVATFQTLVNQYKGG